MFYYCITNGFDSGGYKYLVLLLPMTVAPSNVKNAKFIRERYWVFENICMNAIGKLKNTGTFFHSI